MITLRKEGIYLVDGVPTEKCDVTPEEARCGTIAYNILNAHDNKTDKNVLHIKFDALVSHDITYVGIIPPHFASSSLA